MSFTLIKELMHNTKTYFNRILQSFRFTMFNLSLLNFMSRALAPRRLAHHWYAPYASTRLTHHWYAPCASAHLTYSVHFINTRLKANIRQGILLRLSPKVYSEHVHFINGAIINERSRRFISTTHLNFFYCFRELERQVHLLTNQIVTQHNAANRFQ